MLFVGNIFSGFYIFIGVFRDLLAYLSGTKHFASYLVSFWPLNDTKNTPKQPPKYNFGVKKILEHMYFYIFLQF